MPGYTPAKSLFRTLFRKRELDQNLDDELQSYLNLVIDIKIRQGMNEKKARREALLEFGGVEQVAEKVRQKRIGAVLDSIWQDSRHAVRMLLKKPGFILSTSGTLALGIGVTTVIFSIVNAIVLQPLPIPAIEDLVLLQRVSTQGLRQGIPESTYLDWQTQSRSFTEIGAFHPVALDLIGVDEPVALSTFRVSHTLLPILGIETIRGRTFLPSEDVPGENQHVVIVSEKLWKRRFGSDELILGRMLSIDGGSYSVIGVARLDGSYLLEGDILISLAADPHAGQFSRSLTVIGKLAPDIPMQTAQAEITAFTSRPGDAYTETQQGWRVSALPVRDWLNSPMISRPVYLLLGAAGLLLLLACANVASLLIARGTTRLQEIQIRGALGASRGRIIRQLLTESSLIAGFGAAAGLLLTALMLPVVRLVAPPGTPRIEEVTIDPAVLAFILLLVILTSLLSGLIPAFRIARKESNVCLREIAPSGYPGSHLRNLLVTGEITLATIVLIAAALLSHSYSQLQSVDPGFALEKIITVPLHASGAATGEERNAYIQSSEEWLRALPGVIRVGSISITPFSGRRSLSRVARADRNPQTIDDFILSDYRIITPGLFRTLDIPILAGISFPSQTRRTIEDGIPLPILVSDRLADTLWPDSDPLGQELIWQNVQGPRYTVIGVVGDIRDIQPAADPPPMLYIPYSSEPLPPMTCVIRVADDETGMIPAVREHLRRMDPDLVIPEILPLSQHLARAYAVPNFMLRLFTVFAVLALAMASMGLYSLIVFQVNQRTRELGIRIALGAGTARILRLIVQRMIVKVLIGLVAGTGCAMVLAHLLGNLLYETAPIEPGAFILVHLVLVTTAFLATLIPALRALRIDPRAALQVE